MNCKWDEVSFVGKIKELNPKIEIISPFLSTGESIDCKCLVCGTIFSRRAGNLLRGSTSCPVCLKQLFPKLISDCQLKPGVNDLLTWCNEQGNRGLNLIQEWDSNNGLMENFSFATHTSVNWICPRGHHYITSIKSRTLAKSGCPFCSNQKVLSGFNDLLTKHSLIALEWHPNLNGNLLPSQVLPGSSKEVFWLCPHCTKPYSAPINKRVRRGTGCPDCRKKRRVSFPEKAIFFYLNSFFDEEVFSNYKPIWLNGRELDIYIPSLKIGVEYDGDRWHKNIEKDIEKNNICTFNNLTLIRIREPKCPALNSSSIDFCLNDYSFSELECAIQFVLLKVFLKSNLQKEYQVSLKRDKDKILQLVLPSFSNNSLLLKHPKIASLWHPSKNVPIEPHQVSYGSELEFWFYCKDCGYEWKSTVNNMTTHGRGCPVCSRVEGYAKHTKTVLEKGGSLADKAPDLIKQWHPTKNEDVSPFDVIANSHSIFWWKCPFCGFEWEQSIIKRFRNYNKSKRLTCWKCSHQRSVLQVDLNCNKIIKEWRSISEAERSLGIQGICDVCRGRKKSLGGFRWRYPG